MAMGIVCANHRTLLRPCEFFGLTIDAMLSQYIQTQLPVLCSYLLQQNTGKTLAVYCKESQTLFSPWLMTVILTPYPYSLHETARTLSCRLFLYYPVAF